MQVDEPTPEQLHRAYDREQRARARTRRWIEEHREHYRVFVRERYARMKADPAQHEMYKAPRRAQAALRRARRHLAAPRLPVGKIQNEDLLRRPPRPSQTRANKKSP
jgi:hypothetical protein